MFRLFGILLVGLVFAGCQTTPSSDNIGDAVKTTLNSKHCGNDIGTKLMCAAGGILGGMAGDAIFDGSASSRNSGPRVLKSTKPVDSYSIFVRKMTDTKMCKVWLTSKTHSPELQKEVNRRGLSCVVNEDSQSAQFVSSKNLSQSSSPSGKLFATTSNIKICSNALYLNGSWRENSNLYVQEAKRRGLSCGVSEASSQSTTSSSTSSDNSSPSKLDKAKSTCTDIGFNAGTEKHGECVLKMWES